MARVLSSPVPSLGASLVDLRVIPVLRLSTKEAAAAAIDCLVDAGYRTVEVTLTTPGALELIAELRARTEPGFLVGAGTVLDLDRARACLAALHTVYPDIPLCPTGGVSLTNLADYLKAGAAVVGVGNNIIDQRALAAGDRATVIRHARAFLDLARDGAAR